MLPTNILSVLALWEQEPNSHLGIKTEKDRQFVISRSALACYVTLSSLHSNFALLLKTQTSAYWKKWGTCITSKICSQHCEFTLFVYFIVILLPKCLLKYKNTKVTVDDTMVERCNKIVILSFSRSNSRSGTSASTEFCFGFKVDAAPWTQKLW